MRVLLAGEGRTELGEWAKEAPFRDQKASKGVLVVLIERIGGTALSVADGILWSRIRKYRAGGHASAEERNVLGLVLRAKDARCAAVVFSRDRDGSVARQDDLERGIRRARALFADVRIVGGIAIENIEAWILVLRGIQGERLPSARTKAELAERFGITTVEQKVEVVTSASLDGVPPGSLSAWLDAARSNLLAS